jgi:flagellar biosynthesis/type III secretory pathway M-ring protein FliF/YscJ
VQEVTFQLPEAVNNEPVSLPEKVRLVTLKWFDVIRYGAILVLFVLVYLLLLRPVMKMVSAILQSVEIRVSTGGTTRAIGEREVAGQLAEPVGNEGLLTSGVSSGVEIDRALALKQQIAKNVQTAPQDAGRLVQNWIRGA